jgi:hypothetical protein
MTLHFKRLEPNIVHPCDVCKEMSAEFQQGTNFFCPSCFEVGRKAALAKGVEFVKDINEPENLDGAGL